MKVNVDYSVIDVFQEFLRHKNYWDKSVKNKFTNELKDNDSFKKQLQFHSNHISSKEYFDTFFSSLEEELIVTENPVLKIMKRSFDNILDKKDNLLKKFDNIRQYDFTNLDKRLLETLPKETNIDINIYIVLDGFNAGCIIDDNNMLLDAIFWPSDSIDEEKIEGVILHEYHHLGLLYWLNSNGKRKRILNKKSGKELSVRLIEAVIGEGGATYLFNQNHDITTLLEEGYGKDVAKEYRDSLSRAKTDIEKFLEDFQNDLNCFLNEDDDYEEMKKRLKKYNFSKEFGQPLDKTIGTYLCETIDVIGGRSKLIEIFKSPELFLRYYNNCSEGLNRIKLREDIIEKWEEMWQ